MDTLVVQLTLPTTRRVADFHRRVTPHAGRTSKNTGIAGGLRKIINTHGIYGKGLQISKIKKLTLDIFEDEPVIAIEPHFTKGLIGIHHLHQLENNFVFDVCYNKL
jgi:hypothetical protein